MAQQTNQGQRGGSGSGFSSGFTPSGGGGDRGGGDRGNNREQMEKVVREKQTKLKSLLMRAIPSLKGIVSQRLDPERLCRVFLAATSRRPELLDCTPNSFLNSLMQAASVGLEPETPLGHAYLIPYRNKHTGEMEAVFQISYKGLILIATRSGPVASVTACAVYEKEHFKVMRGTDEKIEHEPIFYEEERGELIAVYAVVTQKNGCKKFDVMTCREIESIRQRAASARSKSPWDTDWEEMAKKTVFRRVLKTIPIENEKLASMVNDPPDGGGKDTHYDFNMPVLDDTTPDASQAEPAAPPVEQQQERAREEPAAPAPAAQASPPARSAAQAQPPFGRPAQPPRNGNLFGGDREPGSDG
jgi:recombination protein RecT